MYEKAKQYTLERPKLRRVVGIVLILAGFAGLALPVLPGTIFLVIGLELFGIRLLLVDRFLVKLFKKKNIPTED